MKERVVNDDVNYVNLKPRLKKDFYVIGVDKKGKSYLTTIRNATNIQAKNEGKRWAKANELTFEGVYSN